MTSPAPVLFCDIRESKTRFPLKRRQRWYFVLLVEGNRKQLMKSENYTNFSDAEDAARLACDNQARVFLRKSEVGNELIRAASELPPF